MCMVRFMGGACVGSVRHCGIGTVRWWEVGRRATVGDGEGLW